MGKSIPDTILDTMLDACEGTRMHICSAEPADYAGIAAVELAAANIVGSYTPGPGDVSGRKNTLPAQTGANALPISADGTANHVAISDGGTTGILYLVTTCTPQALTSGGTVETNAFDHELADPT